MLPSMDSALPWEPLDAPTTRLLPFESVPVVRVAPPRTILLRPLEFKSLIETLEEAFPELS